MVKNRLNPCKVLVLLLYGSFSFVTQDSQTGKLIVKIGPFAKLIRVPNSRFREYLTWLNRNNYIQELELSHGEAEFSIELPPLFQDSTYASKIINRSEN